ncbi:MAG: hypothetical protein U0790_08385 [Isosphaeraceae bacterium]
MVARLWWKDLRQFWPIWALLVLLALVAQGLIIRYDTSGFRSSGGLAILAIGWACLYGYAVAAAAFAGEREAGTLRWLDVLAVERWRLWLAKSSFAAASTLALALVLLAAAALGAERWVGPTPAQYATSVVVVLLGVLGSGLLCSAVTNNASLAAVFAIATSLLVIPAVERWFPMDRYPFTSPWVLGAVALTWAGSFLFFVRSEPPGRRRPEAKRSSRITSSVVRPARATPREEIARPAFTLPAVRSLAWQTLREARESLGWLTIIAFVIPAVVTPLIGGWAELWSVDALLASLLAGSSVFGNDLRRGSHRLLANEGVRPGVIWTVRVAVWLAVLLGVLVLAVVARLFTLSLTGGGSLFGPMMIMDASWIVPLGALAFSIPVLCGMVFRRAITAGVVAILLWFLAWIPLAGLFVMNLLPPAFLVAAPLAILGVSLAWSGDWLVERPGVGRWLRLAGWCVGFFVVTFAAYVAVRASEVPRLEPMAEAQLFGLATPTFIPEDDNAAPLYRKASDKIAHIPTGVSRVDAGGSAPMDDTLLKWLGQNREALDLLRLAAARPYCRFADLEQANAFSRLEASTGHVIAGMLLEVSIRDQVARGDLDGAWKDIAVLFRMARHRMSNSPIGTASSGLHDERRALRLAMAWAADGRQTTARLRAARAAYQAIPRPDPAEPLRAEAQILRNTEALSRSEFVEKTLQMYSVAVPKEIEPMEKLRVDLMTTPWELARFGRAWRIVLGWGIEQARREPWQAARGGGASLAFPISGDGRVFAPPLVNWITQTTPLLQRFLPPVDSYAVLWDRNEVGRRALIAILGIRAWQLEHGGKLPSPLEQVVADGELEGMPIDPYAPNRPFGYIPASGQSLLPLDDPGILWADQNQSPRLRPVPPGYLLYSYGPDGDDDRAAQNDIPRTGGDIIFPLAGSSNGKPGEASGRKGK